MSVGGMNAAVVADLLSGMLAHERCGVHLYRTVAARSNNPTLKRRYEEFGEETLHHVEVLEQLITTLGGFPNYVSPNARAVHGMDSNLVESTFMLNGALDVMTREMAMLDAVFLAESMDQANWQLLSQLVDAMEGDVADTLRSAVDEVEGPRGRAPRVGANHQSPPRDAPGHRQHGRDHRPRDRRAHRACRKLVERLARDRSPTLAHPSIRCGRSDPSSRRARTLANFAGDDRCKPSPSRPHR